MKSEKLYGRAEHAQRRHHAHLPRGDTLRKIRFRRRRVYQTPAAGNRSNRSARKYEKSEAWIKSFGSAAVAPIKFGVSFVTNPAEAINRSASGIANMFDRAGAAMSNQKSSRDNMANSLLGVSDAQRQLAIQLNVDPYSDFAPLQNRLQEMSRVMAGGQLTVKAGLAAVTGGIGMGISAASGMEAAKDTLRDKTAAQVIAEVRATLISLSVPEATINRLIENQNYTPSFLLLMPSLAQLKAQNTAAFIERAADANSYGVAYFHWRRADLIAARSARTWRPRCFRPGCRTCGKRHPRRQGGRSLPAGRPRMDRVAETDLPCCERGAAPPQPERCCGARNDRTGDAAGFE